MRLVFNKSLKLFIFECTAVEKMVPFSARFKFDSAKKIWWTDAPHVAANLIVYADASARDEIAQTVTVLRSPRNLEPVYPDHLTPKDFQKDSVRFAITRSKAYLALDPGLGKTIVSAIVNNTDPMVLVVIAPPFLIYNWEFELKKWTTRDLLIKAVTPKSEVFAGETCDVLLIPDSILSRDNTLSQLRKFCMFKHRDNRKVRLVVDESHRYKSDKSQRTKALLGRTLNAHEGVIAQFDHVVFLSGTPMPNRPRELFTILYRCARETISGRDFFGFAMRYCGAFKDKETGHWDFDGHSNLKELAKSMRATFMLRLRKREVLKELEPKIEKLILLGENLPTHLAKEDARLLKAYSPKDILGGLAPNGHVATYRRKLGDFKAARSSEYIRELLESSDKAVLVFAIHKDTIAKLAGSLAQFDPVVITGATPQAERVALVNAFMTDETKKLFIGNIQACGVGLNLQKASHVVFVEFSWVPAENEQASDRAHRMGQTEQVRVDYLIYRNSLDRQVIEAILRKEYAIGNI